MRILYICHEPLPSPHTNTEQAVKTLAALAGESGRRIDLVYPRGPEGAGGRKAPEEEIADYYGIPRTIFERGIRLIERPVPTFITGKLRLLYHDVGSSLAAGRSDIDLVYVRDPVPLALVLAAGKRVVFESYRCDLSTAAKHRWWRRFCYPHKNLAGVIAHSEKARRLFVKAGIPAEKVITAYNGGLSRDLAPPLDRREARRALGWSDTASILVYTGRISREKGIDTLVDMAGLLENVRFVLVGGLPGSSEFKKISLRIKRLGLTNVSLVPRVPPAEVSLHLAAADILVIPPTAEPLLKYRRTVLPIKTFRYLAAGRPILAPETSDIREILKSGHNALLVPPDSIPEAAAAVKGLLGDDELRGRISQNARQDSKAYTWRRRARLISDFLGRISG